MIYLSMILFLLPTAAGLSMPFNVYTFSAAKSNFIRAYEKSACPADKVICEGGFSAVKGTGYDEAFMSLFQRDMEKSCEAFKGQKRVITGIYATDDAIVDMFVKTNVEEGDWETVAQMSVYYTILKQC